jgi:endonuclease/exonuclease/phosphatase (EEP) superfamily protein YafD
LSISQAELEKALFAGEFNVIAWSAIVALALNYLKSRE